ncbi:MAG: hypothetical protein CM15mP130_0280 [Verrucomicrobiota bacterium]|nr:MAG: hypothetical protein CM15mP130_0280 [Verrucomicrobiota bacterium]
MNWLIDADGSPRVIDLKGESKNKRVLRSKPKKNGRIWKTMSHGPPPC